MIFHKYHCVILCAGYVVQLPGVVLNARQVEALQVWVGLLSHLAAAMAVGVACYVQAASGCKLSLRHVCVAALYPCHMYAGMCQCLRAVGQALM
jgi:hypothetical protein